MCKIVALAGGVGGAKLVKGLAKVIPHQDLSIIVNTGDDFDHFGLNISPDLDTVMYTLAGLSNEVTGWGRKDESWKVFSELGKLSSENWFQLGDLDLATHMERTRLLANGATLTEATKAISEKYGCMINLFPMTDSKVSTRIVTEEYGDIPFQEYFVKYQWKPKIKNLYFKGIENARLNNETRAIIEESDLVIICPSNPWVSILPILSVDDLKVLISKKICIAVSPIIGTTAVKGPAAKMFIEKGIAPSAFEVARFYKGLLDGFVLDKQNAHECDMITGWGIIPLVTNTLMVDDRSKERLAQEIYDFSKKIVKGS